MRGLRILFFMVIPLSFAFGLAWGWKVRHDRESRGTQAATVKTVRLLSLKGLVPPSTLRDLESIAPVLVQMTEVATPKDLLVRWTELKAA
ncbi:MAG: hypothetical protein V4760_00850, partial [Bdellovibrionota bacterium]